MEDGELVLKKINTLLCFNGANVDIHTLLQV